MWFQRPYRVYYYPPGDPATMMQRQQRDGWYFIAFGMHFRVRNWRIYLWNT